MAARLQPSFSSSAPDGDRHSRQVCNHCSFVSYENPKIVVGSVARHDDRILLCRRAIEPQYGLWTIPAGYLELGETPEDGARREAREEANADLSLNGLLAVYTVPHLSQVQLFYRSTFNSPDFSPGRESLEVNLFKWEQIPWDKLAFPTVHWALRHDREMEQNRTRIPFSNPLEQTAGFQSGSGNL
jgi:ADP-ribose pyrophosphatase YjhB (NUDIX family)